MASWAIKETFHRVATQPGSTPKTWDREELIKCRAIGTGIVTESNLKGEIHPVFADWTDSEAKLHEELEQPILLASKILEEIGLPWVSDFLVDDIFDEDYPGRVCGDSSTPLPAYEKRTTPCSIAKHTRVSRMTREKQTYRWSFAQNTLRNDISKSIKWQIDKDIFKERGWNGYTCRHPRGDLPLSEIDKYETIQKFDNNSHKGSRNLTILVMAEYSTRLAGLRRQGEAQGEEYLLTAFMATVTILHELGHAIYWKDCRSLTWDLREPFYGSDLEMELGDSFVAAIFGGWIPVPVCELSRLQEDFSFADGIAWRQALNWDHHRMRPKYRAHYSISVDYIARLFTEASWLATPPGRETALVHPTFLTGNSMALRTVDLYTPLTQSNRHATAAIADFQCNGDDWVWKRRPGAWFRIPQYDGCMYPELELPTAGEDTICPPVAKVVRGSPRTPAMRGPTPPSPSPIANIDQKDQGAAKSEASSGTDERIKAIIDTEVRVRGGDVLSPPLSPSSRAIAAATAMLMKLSPRKSEYSPRKFALGSPTTKISRSVPGGSPALRYDVDVSLPQKRDKVKVSPPPSPPPLLPPGQVQGKRRRRHPEAERPENVRPLRRECYGRQDEKDQDILCAGCGNNNDSVESYDPSEISVEELKKRLSQLIGVSLTELEKLFDGPQCRSAGVE
ncbi:hypothetical protein GGR58DRAFT_509123 [Xylaria digitata]|nr:hypothetical protein GGR58DRAFT_509123 [Xylaria digitata]